MDPCLLEISHLSKSYGGVHALRDVSFNVRAGEIHALCGENGAGKSTVIKCLTGVTVPDEGEVRLAGKSLVLGHVRTTEQAGIAVIHQELTTFPDLDTVDNLFVGREPRRAAGLLLDRRRMERATRVILDRLGQTFDIRRPVRELSVAQCQMVSLARALSHDCKLLILDEPTASLSARETDVLLDVIRRLRDDGVAVLYVSHRLEEIFQMADLVTVLRDGRHVTTQPVSETSPEQLIRWMIGREVDQAVRRHAPVTLAGPPRLEVRALTRASAFQDISFVLQGHEIVGLAGLVGAGRSEIVRAIFGIDDYDSGTVCVDGKPLPPGDIQAAMRHGLALVPEDRQHEGLILPMSVAQNLSMVVLRKLTCWGMISTRKETDLARQTMATLDVRASNRNAAAETLSGGNQQKLVLGKWLAAKPRVLLLDEPTRGVDVGAKAQVHQWIRQLADDGLATLVISSEIPELLALCDRILVLCDGRLTAELDGRTTSHEEVLKYALPTSRFAPSTGAAG